MQATESAVQEMPCPRCKKMHPKGDYVSRPELKKPEQRGVPYGPQDAQCDCGAKLRHTVPLFCVDAYGWHWSIL